MRARAALSLMTALAVESAPALAHADTMDPAIERFTLPTAGGGNCAPNGAFAGVRCQPDQVSFTKLVNQYAAAIAPTAMHSGRTTGYGGFLFAVEGGFTQIDGSQDYWHRGTQGAADPSSLRNSTRNTDPGSLLQLYSIKVSKGFPFGLELAGQAGHLAQSSLYSTGLDIRMSVLEGFRHGALGVLPDIAFGGGVRTLTGTSEFNLTIASFDVQISKQIPVADASILTPYIGFQNLWIFGDSGLIDMTPNTDPIAACHYSGSNVPGGNDPAKKVSDGQPVCAKNGTNADFNNTVVFDNVRLQRKRFIVGLSFRYEMLFVAGQFISDIGSPSDAGGRDNGLLAGEKAQATGAFEVGAVF